MGNTPNVRFKGFTEDWEQRKLGEVAEFNPKSELPEVFEYVDLESVVGTEMVSHRTEIKDSAPSRAQRLAQVGDVFYQTVRPYQKNNYLFEKPDNNYVFSTGYAQLRPFIDARFLMSYLQTEDFVKVVMDNCTGTSYPAINSSDLANIKISLSNNSTEQQQIGTYFSNLGNLITLHQQKCDETKELKKYMLQNMFPQKDEKVPKIRFDGFTGDWEQRKLNEVAEKICVGFVGTCEKFYTDESGVPMYRTGNLNGLSLNRDDLKYVTNEFHQHNQKSQLKAGDILIARHGDSGKAVNYESSEEANCLNIVIIRPDFKKCNYKFLTNCINSPECQKHIKSLSAGSTQAVINTSEIEKLGVVMPTNIDEQNRIAKYFSNLDNLITLHQQKCNALKEFKKYMLQNMFPQKGENKCQN